MSQRRSSGETTSRSAGRWVRALLSSAGLAASALVLGGCEFDSFLDPSVVGRWENTPTIMPILERIDVIERDTGQFVEYTQVLPEDLIPEPRDYRMQPSDGLVIDIQDFVQQGGPPAHYERIVDARGFIDLPMVGRIFMLDKTRVEAEDAIAKAIVEAKILDEPLVTVQVPAQRQQTFGVFGRVQNPGRYVIPRADYKLLEAITDAGGVDNTLPNVYIIRQVALSDVVKTGVKPTGSTAAPESSGHDATKPAPKGDDLLNLIEELTAPPPGSQLPPAIPPPQNPQAEPPIPLPTDAEPAKPEGQSAPGVVGLSALSHESPRTVRRPQRASTTASPGAMSQQDGTPPSIDLVEEDRPKPVAPHEEPGRITAGQWVFLNGEWVQVVPSRAAAESVPEGEDPLKQANPAANLVTQRVIEIPLAPLLQGVAQYNVVLRPGDVINIPPSATGVVYAMGPGIARPGTYNFPQPGQFTLIRLVASAGGLSAIGIPERTDITRLVGQNRQATIRVDARAIFEGTAPDIVLRPDDVVNFGTNFWATPLAILRNGFRASYGFGFIIDRNFGNDIFGAPPTNQFGQ
ncbi:MAG TPA: polysaccharide biosynthesis/export family protein [Phycisphaerales bacterium]|nr:polysaccharide biosynthesis/export family protein [Phycisphaerales bacterium]